MKQFIFLVEGETELVFVRELLEKLAIFYDDRKKTYFRCLKLVGESEEQAPHPWGDYQSADLRFLLINVGGDGSLVKQLKKRVHRFIEAGYEKIICLRDVYPNGKKNRDNTPNDQSVKDFIAEKIQQIEGLHIPMERIFPFFAIMEIEAWLLGFYFVFHNLDRDMTTANISTGLDCDISDIDPEKYFFKPSSVLLQLSEKYPKLNYKKPNIESIMSKIEISDMEKLAASGTVNAFGNFYKEVNDCFC